MEIKNNINNLEPYLNRMDLEKARNAGVRAASTDTQVSQAAEGGDRVSLSTSALKSVVVEAAQSAPDIRQDKVDAIKARLNSGEYQIDSNDIALKLLGSF